LTGPVVLPEGFSLVSGLGDLVVSPGEATTFTVQLDADSAGTYSGEVTFGSDDADEGEFRFSLTGVVAPETSVVIVDDGAVGYSTVGYWYLNTNPGAGFDGEQRLAGPEVGSLVSRWEFTGLTPGQYRVAATWNAKSNRATDAPYTVSDGTSALGTVLVNQEVAPDDFSEAGAVWEYLGGIYTIVGNTLIVQLSNAANDKVIADAIRIERIGD
jgi:hypothetical protein